MNAEKNFTGRKELGIAAALAGRERDENGRIPQKWSMEIAINKSKKYNSRKDFRLCENGAYQYLLRKKLTHLLKFEKEVKKHRLPDWEVYCAAKKSMTRTEFSQKFPSEYSAFMKRKHIDRSLVNHMKPSATGRRWTFDLIKKYADKCVSKQEFREQYPKAYDAAIRHRFLRGLDFKESSKTSDYDTFYIWKSNHEEDGMFLVKIGVTSKRLGHKRIRHVENKSGYKATDIFMVCTKDAKLIERDVLKKHKRQILDVFSGSTEFRYVTAKEYTNLIEWVNSWKNKEAMSGLKKEPIELQGQQLELSWV